MYFVTVSRTQLLLFHLIRAALRRIVLMLPWRTIGMHVPSSFQVLFASKAWTVAEERYIQSRTRYIHVYTCIYLYVRV